MALIKRKECKSKFCLHTVQTMQPKSYALSSSHLNKNKIDIDSIPFGYGEYDILSKSGKPMKLQKLWHKTGPIRCPENQKSEVYG